MHNTTQYFNIADTTLVDTCRSGRVKQGVYYNEITHCFDCPLTHSSTPSDSCNNVTVALSVSVGSRTLTFAVRRLSVLQRE